MEKGDPNSNQHAIKNESLFDFQIGDLIASVIDASSVNIENLGWFMFGGFLNELETSQKLESLNSMWKRGPAVFKSGINSQCVVKVKIHSNYPSK